MDDLASELAMSKKTFYAHFDSKVALVEAVLQAKLNSVESDLERITQDSTRPFPQALQELLACLQGHTGEIQPVFFRDIRRQTPEVFAGVEKRRAAIIDNHFSKLLLAGQKAGMIRKDIPLRLIIEILLAVTQAIMNPQKIEQLKMTPKAGYSAILDILLTGVLTSQGRNES